MAKPDTISTRTVTPGKKGVRIDRQKYEVIRDAILGALEGTGTIEFRALPAAVKKNLKQPFDGSIAWYTATVKLDLERRKIIERIPGVTPQQLRLTR